MDQEGKEVKGATTNKDDVRTKSPTNSEESKENIEEEFDQNVPVDDNGNTVKYPCPECKKGFSKLGNVYKHLHNVHGRTKDEYTKLRQEIQVKESIKFQSLTPSVGMGHCIGCLPQN